MAETKNTTGAAPAPGAGAVHDAAAAEAGAETGKKGGSKLVLIVAIVGVLLLAAAGAMIFLLMNRAPSDPNQPPQIVQPEDGPMLQLDEMIVNIGGASSGHYARVQLALEFYDEYGYDYFMGIDPKSPETTQPAEGALVPNVIRAHDALLGVLSESKVTDFDDIPAMKQAMLNAVNGVLYQPVVKDVHFIERAVQ